jgi:hypothetical protein
MVGGNALLAWYTMARKWMQKCEKPQKKTKKNTQALWPLKLVEFWDYEPMVEMKFGVNLSSSNRRSRELFPTPADAPTDSSDERNSAKQKIQ